MMKILQPINRCVIFSWQLLKELHILFVLVLQYTKCLALSRRCIMYATSFTIVFLQSIEWMTHTNLMNWSSHIFNDFWGHRISTLIMYAIHFSSSHIIMCKCSIRPWLINFLFCCNVSQTWIVLLKKLMEKKGNYAKMLKKLFFYFKKNPS